jgi:hypothetical protein
MLARQPGVRAHCAALSFHTWNTTDPEDYTPWSRLARQLDIPLIVGEVGTDASAWKTPWLFDSYLYAVQEVRMYQELLAYARPSTALHWQFTRNYGIVGEQDGRAVPGKRYWIMRQFCNLTPLASAGLPVSSSRDDVLLSAFRRGDTPWTWQWAVHVANLGAARRASLTGLPPGLRLHARTTSPEHDYEAPEPLTVPPDGRLELNLPALCLQTLSTVDDPFPGAPPRDR